MENSFKFSKVDILEQKTQIRQTIAGMRDFEGWQ